MRIDSSAEPIAEPSTTEAAGKPASAAVPASSPATIVPTVTAAMWPVLPIATPATSVQIVRWRRWARREGERARDIGGMLRRGQPSRPVVASAPGLRDPM